MVQSIVDFVIELAGSGPGQMRNALRLLLTQGKCKVAKRNLYFRGIQVVRRKSLILLCDYHALFSLNSSIHCKIQRLTRHKRR
jgi:hypothetical protein